MGILDQHALGLVREAQLSPRDIHILGTFAEAGGEFPFYVDRLKAETKNARIADMNSLIARDIIEVDTKRSTGHRWMVRLTDYGRSICAELEKMNVKRPVEVQMQGDTPEVKVS